MKLKLRPSKWWFWLPKYIEIPEKTDIQSPIENLDQALEQALEADEEAWYNPGEETNVVIAEPDFIPIKRAEAKKNELQNPFMPEQK